MIADALRRLRVWLHVRTVDDEEYVEKCRKWLRREKTSRLVMGVGGAMFLIALVYAVVKPFAILRYFQNDTAHRTSLVLGFIAGAPFWCALCGAIWAVIVALGGPLPQKRTRELMLRFHDELKRQGRITGDSLRE